MSKGGIYSDEHQKRQRDKRARNRAAIYQWLLRQPDGALARALAAEFFMSSKTIQTHMRGMIDDGRVEIDETIRPYIYRAIKEVK